MRPDSATGQLASAPDGDTGKHCFLGNFHLINLTKISLLFLSPKFTLGGGINPLVAVF